MSHYTEEIRKKKEQYKNSISWSQLTTFDSCPHQWELAKIKDLDPFSQTVHTIGGTAMHETIQEYLTRLYGKSEESHEDMDLKEWFKSELKGEYDKALKDLEEDQEPPCSMHTLIEYYKKSLPILDKFLEDRDKYFNPKETELVAIEEPITEEVSENIIWIGFLDVVLKRKDEEFYYIIDIKTSTKGWSKFKKEDPHKTNQLVAYKKFYAQKHNIPLGDIYVKFWIVARNLNKWTDRIEEFAPKSGKKEREQVDEWTNRFLKEGFKENGEYTDKELEKKPSRFGCAFCPFSQVFENEVPVCDSGGWRPEYKSYPKGMKGHIDEKWIKL